MSQPAPGVTASITRGLWAALLLNKLNKPSCPENINGIVAWIAAETGPTGGASFNPLNTTRSGYSGASAFNTITDPKTGAVSHVWNYPSVDVGLQATADTINQPNFALIRSALDKCNPQALTSAVGMTKWGTNPTTMWGAYQAMQRGQSTAGLAILAVAGGGAAGLPSVQQVSPEFATGCVPPSGLGSLNPAGWIGFFYCRLNTGNYLLRALEMILGIILLVTGLALLGMTFGTETKISRTVTKVGTAIAT